MFEHKTPIRPVLIVLSLLAGVAATSGVARAAPPAAPPIDDLEKVDEVVLDAVDGGGETKFWVRLDEHADLSEAAEIEDWAHRGAYVVEQLRGTADTSQAAVRAKLDASDTPYTSYWITNALQVTGDEAVVRDLADEPSVEAILAPAHYAVPEPISERHRNSPAAVEWGVARINADDVWSEFGVRGEGIVVANIDTGVQYDHPALVGRYRGNLGGGTFDHNYNWWDPSHVCATPAPCDNHGHGTHTMGTMVGDDGGANQIGAAPGARWIGVKGCETNNCSDAALLSAGQFVLAPTDLTGANPRPDLRPHIVNNSWGGDPGDPWYADMVDAWRAGGIFPQFSNGNSGPGCGSASSPGDYPDSYSAGAFDVNGAIAGFSSRGESAFGGIKPNVAAPGVNIRSSVPGSGYANASGTSMASPHVAGTVALIWSAAPDHIGDLSATMNALDATAHDVEDLQCGGTAADNNVWGEGTLDALAAVRFARSANPVTLTGTVTDGSGHGWPLYARIDIAGLPGEPVFTDPATGSYSVQLEPDSSYELTATALGGGYRPSTRTVTVTTGSSTQDFTLGVAPACTAAGYRAVEGFSYLHEPFDNDAVPTGWTVVNRTPAGGWLFNDPGGRSNLTGGSGRFAIMDSDFLGIGNTEDSDLVTPALNLSTAIGPVVSFRSDYRSFPNSSVDIDYSVDSGSTWTNVWHHTTESRRGPRVETVPIPAAGEPHVQIRFRYRGTWAWWWQIDDVVVRDGCEPVPGGLVVGSVSDLPTGDAIDGATVASDDAPADVATTGPTPDDPNVGDGFYTLFSSVTGSHPFTAGASGHLPTTEPVEVLTDSVVRQDFQLGVPVQLSIADAEFIEPDTGTAPRAFTISADPAPATPITVVVQTADGSAGAPSDYTALPAAGQLVAFAAGQSTRTVTVRIVGDLLKEPDESFTVTLSNPSGAFIGDGTADGRITNDDTCTIVGTVGGDTLAGTAGHDEICGLGGADTIDGRGGNDTLRGGIGNDVLRGQAGNDRVDGEGGADQVYGSGGADSISGGNGNDTVRGGAGNDALHGQAGNDLVDGQGGVDLVHGEDGTDVVRGGLGNDISPGGTTAGVHGGPGVDTIDGGPGADWCSPSTAGESRTRCEVP